MSYRFPTRGLPESIRPTLVECRKRADLKRFLLKRGFLFAFDSKWDTELMAYFAKGVKRGEYRPC